MPRLAPPLVIYYVQYVLTRGGAFYGRTEREKTDKTNMCWSVGPCFRGKNETVEAEGFYDGEGRYVVRFMPSFEGEYQFEIQADFLEETERGSFRVLPAEAGNHGPVRVANTWHFACEDGTPYYPVGTTCYVWELQDDARIEETLNSLKEAGFNKIRFCVFPKHYDYNLKEPRSYPYEGTPMDSGVLTKENFWDILERRRGITGILPGSIRRISSILKNALPLSESLELRQISS